MVDDRFHQHRTFAALVANVSVADLPAVQL